MGIRINETGLISCNTGIYECILSDNNGLSVHLTNLGASVLSIFLPNKDGTSDDILLGYNNIGSLLESGPMFGATLGRCSGRIKNASFVLNGNIVMLSKNNGGHHSHGGFRGFDKREFQILSYSDGSVTMTRRSADGEEGYPGNLDVTVTYSIFSCGLKIEYKAITDLDTVVSLSNHMYYNLRGHDKGDILRETVHIDSDYVAGFDEDMIPDGSKSTVCGTPLDLNKDVALGERLTGSCINSCPSMSAVGGFDHDYILKHRDERIPAAVLSDSVNGRSMNIYTDMPCMHFYTADFSKHNIVGKRGVCYNDTRGVCFEPQYTANAVNTGMRPSPILKAGVIRQNYYYVKFKFF